ncbi:MAG: hypothetical protein IAE97_07625 [Chthoniobacterales bacterium]|nr:hypothetical protein [Chthoniobacterales bacterium]
MRHPIPLLAGLALLASMATAPALAPTELAAFLAGRQLPPGSPLAPLQQSREYQQHAREYAAQWFRYNEKYFSPMREWSSTELVPRIGPAQRVTYLFGGPDLISAMALFPSAELYTLGGLEPVGRLTNPLSLTPEEIHASLAVLRKSTEVIMNFSHFITKDMKTDLASSHFQGVFPIMLVFLSFTDAHIDLVERLTLQRDGTLAPGEDAKGQAALRIVFRRSPMSPPSEVVYLQSNVADGPLKENSAILDWMASRGPSTGYLKAASYLPHEGGFSRVRDFLLDHSSAILQDDSGIPLSVFRARDWQVIYFGSYTTPLEIFSKYDQPALRMVYEEGRGFPLPFGFGYRWQRGESTLLLAIPPGAAPRALPAPPPPLLQQ